MSLRAVEKQKVITGGDVNYYLQVIKDYEDERRDVTVEIEDIIEALAMSFALGNVFKALVRMCKLRQDLGKPGSNPLYEAEKIVYYSARTLVVSERRLKAQSKLTGYMRAIRNALPFIKNKTLPTTIRISDPKRLVPYSFAIDAFVEALLPTRHEAQALKDLLTLALIRLRAGYDKNTEVYYAQELVYNAKQIERRERVALGLAPTKDM